MESTFGAGRLAPIADPAAVAVAVCCLLAAAPADAQHVPPDDAWRTIETAHFRVTVPERLETLGRRAATLAEQAHRDLTAQFIEGPAGPIDLVVTDHVDVSNGWAQFRPSNRIVLFARPPVDHLALAYFDDWLQLVITHELAHLFHLDHTGRLGSISRALLGRAPWDRLTFPGAIAPPWIIEGLATWYESALTHAGRVRGTLHEMVLRTAALEGRFETLGQAGGDSPAWPGGLRQYAYGSRFFEYLLDKHGPGRMAAFVDGLVRRKDPFLSPRLDAAGRHAFGASLSSEWDAWTIVVRTRVDRLDTDLAAFGPVSAPEALTRGAREGLHPEVSPQGRDLVYSRSDGRSDPRLVVLPVDGGRPSTLTRTNHVTPLDILPSGEVVFAQRDFVDQYRNFSDLYVASRDGTTRRVTHGARLTAPAAGPDGTWVTAVAEGNGTNALVEVDLQTGAITPVTAPADGTYWAFPAVSPNGRWIAATRWTTGGAHDIVLLDTTDGVVHEVTRDRALDFAPAWSADGRRLVWSSDRTGILNILGVDIDSRTGAAGPPRLLTNVRTGAAFPSLGPAGVWLYFSGYHADGWEVERVPFAPGRAPRAPDAAERFTRPAADPDQFITPDPPAGGIALPAASDGRFITPDTDAERTLLPAANDAAGPAAGDRAIPGATPAVTPGSDPDTPAQDYSPLATLRPTYWTPWLRGPVATAQTNAGDIEVPRTELLGHAVGGRTSGFDLVGRHAYTGGARVFIPDGNTEGDLSYEYRGFGNPIIGLAASQTWNHDGVRVAAPETFFVLARERRVAASMTLARPRNRSYVAATVSGGLVRSDRELLDATLRPTDRYTLSRAGSTLSEFAVSLAASTARSHAFQLGNTRGVSLFLRARTRRDLNAPGTAVDRGVPGGFAADDIIGRFTAYAPLPGPGFATPVLALRANVGAARGPGTHTGYFDVGGTGGAPLFGGYSIFFPIRGYETSSRSGRRAWTASVEVRAPLALVNRGFGAWPLHVDRVFGSVFVDAGNAWGAGPPSSSAVPATPGSLASAGLELSTILRAFQEPLQVRVGAAFPLVEGTGTRYYIRLGVPF